MSKIDQSSLITQSSATAATMLTTTMDRRQLLRLIGAASAAAVVTGIARATDANAAAGNYWTTSDLNLRAKPSTSAKVLLVIPSGEPVEEIGTRKNGYMKCRYGGKTGWAYEEFLKSSVANDGPQIVGIDATNTDVNLRSGPSTSHQVLRVLEPGSEINVSNTVENGFRYVVHLGLAGWVWDAFIGGGGPSAGPEKLTTTSALNHRAKASTSAAVLSVIPEGAKVGDLEESSNGFRKVSYQGAIGWCWADYLT